MALGGQVWEGQHPEHLLDAPPLNLARPQLKLSRQLDPKFAKVSWVQTKEVFGVCLFWRRLTTLQIKPEFVVGGGVLHPVWPALGCRAPCRTQGVQGLCPPLCDSGHVTALAVHFLVCPGS